MKETRNDERGRVASWPKAEGQRQRPTQTELRVETDVKLPQVKEPLEAGRKAWNRSFLGKYGLADIVILDF